MNHAFTKTSTKIEYFTKKRTLFLEKSSTNISYKQLIESYNENYCNLLWQCTLELWVLLESA